MLISYTANQDIYKGFFNKLIRWRLSGKYSHNEIVFPPDSGVDNMMPDGTCAPDKDGALWCLSSSATDPMPAWSTKRIGKKGGVRFKRIVINDAKWDQIPTDPKRYIRAAMWGNENAGCSYDWRLILGFIAWPINLMRQRDSFATCSKAVAAALGVEEAWRFDPCNLHALVRYGK